MSPVRTLLMGIIVFLWTPELCFVSQAVTVANSNVDRSVCSSIYSTTLWFERSFFMHCLLLGLIKNGRAFSVEKGPWTNGVVVESIKTWSSAAALPYADSLLGSSLTRVQSISCQWCLPSGSKSSMQSSYMELQVRMLTSNLKSPLVTLICECLCQLSKWKLQEQSRQLLLCYHQRAKFSSSLV